MGYVGLVPAWVGRFTVVGAGRLSCCFDYGVPTALRFFSRHEGGMPHSYIATRVKDKDILERSTLDGFVDTDIPYMIPYFVQCVRRATCPM